MCSERNFPAMLLKGLKSTPKTHVVIAHPTCMRLRRSSVLLQGCVLLRATAPPRSPLCTQGPEPGICTQLPLGWDHPGTDKLRHNPSAEAKPATAQRCVSVCGGTYGRPETSIYRSTHRVATHRGCHRQETEDKDKMPGRQGESRWRSVLLREHIW